MKTVLIAIVVLLIAVIGMCFRILFVKGGKFPCGHHTPELQRRGVKCASRQSCE